MTDNHPIGTDPVAGDRLDLSQIDWRARVEKLEAKTDALTRVIGEIVLTAVVAYAVLVGLLVLAVM